MAQLARLIVPLDTSSAAEAVLPWAALVARDHGMSILLVSVWSAADPIPGLTGGLTEAEGMARLREYLDRVAPTGDLRGLGVDSRVASGDPATEIAQLAAEVPGSMVMLASHGRGGYREGTLGSVSERLLRTLRCPVLVIPAEPGA